MIIALDRHTGYTVVAADLRLLLQSIKQLEKERDDALAQQQPKEQS